MCTYQQQQQQQQQPAAEHHLDSGEIYVCKQNNRKCIIFAESVGLDLVPPSYLTLTLLLFKEWRRPLPMLIIVILLKGVKRRVGGPSYCRPC